jgi:hypothetical protein
MVVHWFSWYADSKVTVYMGAALFTTTLAIALTFVFDFLADQLEGKFEGSVINYNSTETAGGSVSDAEALIPHSSTSTMKNNKKSKRSGTMTNDDIGQHVATSTRGLISVFGLLVGLSWEAVFEVGEHDMVLFVNNRLKEERYWEYEHPVLVELVLSIAVLACVVPVWAKHLIPAAEEDRAYHKKRIEEEKNSKTKDMFTFTILKRLWLSCCPVWRRVSFCKGRGAKAR